MARMKKNPEVVQSSGNVFADLGLTRADEKQTKVRLAVAINRIIENQRLSQIAAARRLKINQPKISALSNYRLHGFSVERLMNFLTALDRDIEIVIRSKPTSRRDAKIMVTLRQFDDFADVHLAERALQRVRSGEERTTPLEIAMKRHEIKG